MGFRSCYTSSWIAFFSIVLIWSTTRVFFTSAQHNLGFRPQSKYAFALSYGDYVNWNPEEDSWLRLYVMMCGYFCDESRLVEVRLYEPSVPFCSEECYKCDCSDTCVLYGTCCPYLDSSTPIKPEDLTERYRKNLFVGSFFDLKFKDMNSIANNSISLPNKAVTDDIFSRAKCIPINFGNGVTSHVFGIADCPKEETDEQLRRLCERYDPELSTIDYLSPISDSRNGVVYKNVYCLKCWERNDKAESLDLVEDITALTDYDDQLYIRWNISIECAVYQGLYKLNNVSKFLSIVYKNAQSTGSQKSPYCSLTFDFDSDNKYSSVPKPKPCYSHPSSEPPPCNGIITNNDMTSSQCAGGTRPAYSVSGNHNVFCVFCNDKTINCGINSRIREMTGITISSPINFLLGDRSAVIRGSGEMQSVRINVTYQCPRPLEWMDESDECQLPSCADGKELDMDSGTCKTIIPMIEGLGYKLAMVFKPDQKIASDYNHIIVDKFETFYKETMSSGYLALYMIVFGTEESDEYDIIKYIKLQGNFVAKFGIKRDSFEEAVLNYDFSMSLYPEQNITVNLMPGGMGVDHVGRMGIMEYTQGNPEDQYHLPKTWDAYDYSDTADSLYEAVFKYEANQLIVDPIPEPIPEPPVAQTHDPDQSIALKTILAVEVGTPKMSDPTWVMKSEFINLSPTLLCPFVIFDIKETSTINETNLLITFYYKGREKSINTSTHERNLTIEDHRVKICIETFRDEFQKITIREDIFNKTEVEITWMSAVKRHFTIGCLILSVICLLFTSVTYSLFSQLRTLPGLNTLSLCLTLASAHLTLILVVELVGYVDGWVCIALGIALHYTWLSSFCWMGVCCVHMYLVFKGTNTRQGSTRNPTDKHTQYRICAFGTSAVMVSLYICVCEIVSDGTTTGYSDQICFFDTDWSILTVMVSFVAPLVILLIINTVLFGITVREMVLVRRMQAVRRVKSRDELLTYVKLSTITGVQWLVSLLAIRINSDATDIAVAFLVGLQGVFIFISFTLNKNTRNLYRNVCGGSSGVSLVGSSSSRGTIKTSQSSNNLPTQVTDV